MPSLLHLSLFKSVNKYTFARGRRSGPKSVGPARPLGRPRRRMSFRANVLDHRRHFGRVRARDRTVGLDVRTSARGRSLNGKKY